MEALILTVIILGACYFIIRKIIKDKKNKIQEKIISANNENKDVLVCPQCGSKNIHVDKRGYNAGDACCGAILLGPLGLLCGADGSNKLVKTCLNCNKEF
jgi:hypothetical protein